MPLTDRSFANGLVIAGSILVIVGLLGFAIPIFATQQTEDVAKIGDLHIQTTERTLHVIPPVLAGGVHAVGVILIGGGLYQKR